MKFIYKIYIVSEKLVFVEFHEINFGITTNIIKE
jgi:hypothetical protein